MTYITTFLCGLVAAMTGVVSYRYAFWRESVQTDFAGEENADERKSERKSGEPGLRTVLLSKKRMLTYIQWLPLATAAAAIAVCAFRLLVMGLPVWLAAKFLLGALVLLAALLIDLRLRIIPNRLVLGLLAVGVLYLIPEYLLLPERFWALLIGSLLGLLVCFLLFFIMSRMTKGGIGMGDVKLLAAMGMLLGIEGAINALIFSMVACLLVSLALLISKKKKAKDHIPFGPFIFIGYCITIMLGMI